MTDPSGHRPLPLRRLAVAGVVALACFVLPAGAQQLQHAATTDGTLLTVSAHGESTRVPDVARISTGVVTEATDAKAAMQANAAQMEQVLSAVRKAGIADRDIRTSSVNLYPQYRHEPDGSQPRISGYQASNTLDVTVRDLARLGPTIDALVATGANQVSGPHFEVSQQEQARDEARRAALATARERATMYADELGLRVQRIVHINEGTSGMRPPVPMMAMARMESASADTPIAPGESTLAVDLDVIFELGK